MNAGSYQEKHSGLGTSGLSVTVGSNKVAQTDQESSVTNNGSLVGSLSRDTTNTNGTVAQTPDVNAILNQQADTMQAAQAAGQVVAQGIGDYAQSKQQKAQAQADAATKAGDTGLAAQYQAVADSWDEGGANRILLHVAGGALIGGLGGGGIGDAVGGAAGAGLSAAMAKQLDDIYKGVGSATGSELLGNIAANVVAGVGGALVGGGVGATTASNVELYNQSAHRKPKDLVSQVCPAGAQCSDAVLNAAIQAQGDLNSVAQGNVADVSLATTAAIGIAAVGVLGPEAIAAYKAAQAAYSMTTAAITGAGISSGIYTGSAVISGPVAQYQGGSYSDAFNQNFSVAGLATAAAFGAANNMAAVSMYEWAGVPNSIRNWGTIPGAVIQTNKLAIGQIAGKAAQAIVDSNSSKD